MPTDVPITPTPVPVPIPVPVVVPVAPAAPAAITLKQLIVTLSVAGLVIVTVAICSAVGIYQYLNMPVVPPDTVKAAAHSYVADYITTFSQAQIDTNAGKYVTKTDVLNAITSARKASHDAFVSELDKAFTSVTDPTTGKLTNNAQAAAVLGRAVSGFKGK